MVCEQDIFIADHFERPYTWVKSYRDYRYYVRQYRTLTSEETIECIERAQKGDNKAMDILVKSNQRLILYTINSLNIKKDYLDFIQEANLALVRAINNFDISQGHAFSTYAYSTIVGYVKMALYKSSSVYKTNYYTREATLKIREYLSQHPNASVDEINEALRFHRDTIYGCLNNDKQLISLEEKKYSSNKEDSKEEIKDFVSSQSDNEMLNKIYLEELSESVLSLLDNLKEIEKDVILKRFPPDGSKPMTLQAIADERGCTKEWIRQKEQAALRKLKKMIQNSDDYKIKSLSEYFSFGE